MKENNWHTNEKHVFKAELNPLMVRNDSSHVTDVWCMKARLFHNKMYISKTVAYHAMAKWEKELESTIKLSKALYNLVKILVAIQINEIYFWVLSCNF